MAAEMAGEMAAEARGQEDEHRRRAGRMGEGGVSRGGGPMVRATPHDGTRRHGHGENRDKGSRQMRAHGACIATACSNTHRGGAAVVRLACIDLRRVRREACSRENKRDKQQQKHPHATRRRMYPRASHVLNRFARNGITLRCAVANTRSGHAGCIRGCRHARARRVTWRPGQRGSPPGSLSLYAHSVACIRRHAFGGI